MISRHLLLSLKKLLCSADKYTASKNRFIATYYRQLSADIKMKSYEIKPSFVSPQEPKARGNKTGIDILILHFNILGKLSITRCCTRFFSMAFNPT